jgi:putative oxidoreductase
MKHLPTVARILLGLVFFGAGLAGFITRFAFPPDPPEGLLALTRGFAATTYFMPLLKGTELACGLLLLSGAYVPLALVVLAPIVLNIFLTHLFLAPSGLPLAIVIGLLEAYLAFFAEPYRSIVRQIFRCPKCEARHAAR